MNIFEYLFTWASYILHSFIENSAVQLKNDTKPHIIVIMTDDMGWNDLGFHGSNEIPTPNIDALAYNGVILNRHYAMPTCTPSRAAFLTGRHPIRMGLQGLPINVAEPRGIPLREKLLPEYLSQLGYVTRLVGKWHLGYYSEKHTPARRGFDSFAGYYGGYIRYFDHTVTKNKQTGIDFHWDTPKKIEPFNNSQYLTDFITDQAKSIIKNHDKQKPLYLHLAHLAAHASEGADPIEVRNMTEVNSTLGYIPDVNRRKYAGIVTAMDESVGEVVKALSEADLLSNSIIVFMSDNGAPSSAAPFNNYGSNYPLRGIKSTVFEGAVRVPAFVFSPYIQQRSRVTDEFLHITDWLPTLYKIAGGDPNNIQNLDGIDQWPSISDGKRTKRESMLLNIDEVLQVEAAIVGDYKLVKNGKKFSDFYGKDGNVYSPSYNVKNVLTSAAAESIKKILSHSFPKDEKLKELRRKATISCEYKPNFANCSEACLFNIVEDPCETTDISEIHPEKVIVINTFMDGYRSVLMHQTNTYIYPEGYPSNFNGYWMPWLDYEYIPPKDRNVSAIWNVNAFCEGYPIDDPRNCL